MALGTSAEIVRTYGARAESAPSLSRVLIPLRSQPFRSASAAA